LEGVLDDFTEDIGDSLLNLFVDTGLNILLWVVDVCHALVARLEDHAIALLVQVEHVMRGNGVAFAGAEWVHAFFGIVSSFACAVIQEARGLTDTLLLDIELGTHEVTAYFETFSLILNAGGS
jgi:uncharacterized protein YggL (DUF469 family)